MKNKLSRIHPPIFAVIKCVKISKLFQGLLIWNNKIIKKTLTSYRIQTKT